MKFFRPFSLSASTLKSSLKKSAVKHPTRWMVESLEPRKLFSAVTAAPDLLLTDQTEDAVYVEANPAPLLAQSLSVQVTEKIGTVGSLTLNNTNWQTVTLSNTYTDPVVIAGPAAKKGADPVTMRVRNVTSNSFEIALQEWDYLDGTHSNENVSYLVVEAGTHTLADGTTLVAGHSNTQTNAWQTYNTGSAFDADPIVFSQVMSENEADAVTTRTRILSNNSFELQLEEEESSGGSHAAETVGYVAIEAGSGTIDGLQFASFNTPDSVTDASYSVSFGTTFSSTPAFFASMQTTDGLDTATVRRLGLNNSSATINIEEEQSANPEVAHTSEVVGVLAIETGDLMTTISVVPSDRFDDLEGHILGNDTMTFAEFQAWSDAFDLESGTLASRLDDFVAAAQVVELYESEVGPLFTPEGVSSFKNTWPDTDDGQGLERSISRVYQALFDAVSADLIAAYPSLADGLMFRSTEYFPGTVPPPTDPTAVYQMQIDGTLDEEFGSPGAYENNPARRMTGAYLAPGTIAEVTVPQELVNAGYTIRVGGHSWDLSNKAIAYRLHRVSNQFEITSTTTQIANPMGGNIYIEVPVGGDAGLVDIQFTNTVRAPFFSARSFDQTTQSEWEDTERYHLGAFTDIESEHSMWTVPTKWVTSLGYSELMEIIDAHDASMQTVSEYIGKNTDRPKALLYMIVDTQIRSNAFSIGYPQSNYGSFSNDSISRPLSVANAFSKVLWHEHGHAELLTMFTGETEAEIHMLALVVGMENYGMTLQEAFAESLIHGPADHTTSDALNSWVVMDEFINGEDMQNAQASYRPRGHGDYAEYIELFGLDAMKNFNRQINIEMDGLEWSSWTEDRRNHNYNDRILRLSREAGVNVAPLFHLWGHAPDDQAALATALQAEGIGDSAAIYERMIDARNSVPRSQAEWDALYDRIGAYLENNRGPWVELNANYDLGRARDAVDRIDELIDLYFPNGHPGVTIYSDSGFSGDVVTLAPGAYNISDLNATAIGNDNVSSIEVPSGWTVIAHWHDFNGEARTYTASTSSLGTFNNRISSLEIIPPGVTIYSDSGFSGDAVTLTPGAYSISDLNATAIGNDNISSIEVPSGWSVIAHWHNFNGEARTYTASTSSLGTFNNRISSLEIIPPGVTIYSDSGFSGDAVTLTPGAYNISDLNATAIGNDNISSIEVPSGWTVIGYWHSDFNGEVRTYTASTSSLSTFNNRISSLEIIEGSPLQAAASAQADQPAESMSDADLTNMVRAAQFYWSSQGADTMLFPNIRYEMTNINDGLLGLQSDDVTYINADDDDDIA